MSLAKKEGFERLRNIVVGFRVSPEENRQLNETVTLSGLPKQEYCYLRCMNREMIIKPNPRAFKGLKTVIENLTDEMKRISDATELTDENFDSLRLIIAALTELKGGDGGE